MKYIRENLEWRPLVGYEEDYEVSNYGDFKLLAKTYVNKGFILFLTIVSHF